MALQQIITINASMLIVNNTSFVSYIINTYLLSVVIVNVTQFLHNIL